MKLKTHSLKKDCDIIIDFGDDSERLVVRTAEIGTNGLKKYDESSWESHSECVITINHKYTAPFVNHKLIVTIYGDDIFTFRVYDSSSSKSILSRIFDDLPFSRYIQNVSSGLKSNRIQQVHIKEYNLLNIKNWASSFAGNKNLIKVSVDDSPYNFTNQFLCVNNMFDGCVNLESSDFKLPVYVSNDGVGTYPRMYAECSSLTSDLTKDLLPTNGFIGKRICMSEVFINCKNITGQISSISSILWEDTSKDWVVLRPDNKVINTFKGCEKLSLEDIPEYWGGKKKSSSPVSSVAITKLKIEIPYDYASKYSDLSSLDTLTPYKYDAHIRFEKSIDKDIIVDWGDGTI